MVFSSIPFLFFFLPIFLGLYFLLPKKNIILLIASLIFYAWGEPIYILLMIFSSITDYTLGRLIEKKRQKRYLVISIIINLALLFFFKYIDFFIGNVNNLLSINIPLLELGLPIGISFFTFQTMSYSIDVYRKNIKAEKNFLNFMMYVSMFPQLIAGPIVRYIDISKEINNRKPKIKEGTIRFLNGLFKKVLLANNLGLLFTLLTSTTEISVLTSWLAAISFTLQIYFDFSGYSDMAIGLGKILGFNYPENFNYPFIAKSITDFWRRWHISLSSWFKDYLYIPLGGNKTNALRNIIIVWLLTGFWHGASWNFIIWGLYFAVILIIEKYILKDFLAKTPSLFKHIGTVILIIISFYIFAFDNMNDFITFIPTLFGIGTTSFIDDTFLFYLSSNIRIIIIAIVLSTPILKGRIKYNWIIIITYIILFILTVAFLVSDTYNPFLYFRF